MLIAAGVVMWGNWLESFDTRKSRLVVFATWLGLILGTTMGIALMLPVAPVNSGLWDVVSEVHDNFVEQIGWTEMNESAADIYSGLPVEEQSRTEILTANYGEAGAVNLYEPAYGLPEAISGVNSYWSRGYGNPPPETLIVLGFDREAVDKFFKSCKLVGHVTNQYGVENEETTYHPNIFLCTQPRYPWPDLWKMLRSFA
jgi:hypothetical protein